VSCKERAIESAAPQSTTSGEFSVDPGFIGGPSILAAAKRASPESQRISLSRPVLGSDARYDYATFFVGRDTHGGFESTYFRYWIFAKLKSSRDWSEARVFDWPRDYIDPFIGPVSRLEKEGRELPEKPNQSLQPTAPSGRG